MRTLLILLFLQGLPHMQWQPLAPMPVAAAGGHFAAFESKIVYAGGATWQDGVKRIMTETQVYDAGTGHWTAGPELPEPLAYGAFSHTRRGLEVYGGVGAEHASHKCWLLDSASGAWRPCSGNAGDTVLATSQAVGNTVLIFGGCPNVTDLAKCGSSVRRKDRDGSWTKVSELPQGPVSLMASAVLNGSVYLFGGASMTDAAGLENRADAYRFDAATLRWTRLRALPRAARGMTAVTLDSRYILVGGGYVASVAEAAGKSADFGFSAAAYLYDTVQDQYHATTPMPVAAAGLALLESRGALLAIGGEDRMRARSAKVFRGQLERTPSR